MYRIAWKMVLSLACIARGSIQSMPISTVFILDIPNRPVFALGSGTVCRRTRAFSQEADSNMKFYTILYNFEWYFITNINTSNNNDS